MTDPGPIRHMNPPELGEPPGYSQVVEVRCQRLIFIAGQTALNFAGAARRTGGLCCAGGASLPQSWRRTCVHRMHRCQPGEADGLPPRHGPPPFLSAGAQPVLHDRLAAGSPAITLIEVSSLYGAGFLLEIEAIAAI